MANLDTQIETGIDNLGKLAADFASLAAVDYIHLNGIEIDLDSLVTCLRANVKLRITEAIQDASEALGVMGSKMAEATFAASMRIAGIEAAQEANHSESCSCRFH